MSTPRNSLYSCGSGKKFKKCCMESPAVTAKRNQLAWAPPKKPIINDENTEAPARRPVRHMPMMGALLMAGALMGGMGRR